MPHSMLSQSGNEEVYERIEPAISATEVLAFKKATCTVSAEEVPLTFITRFRHLEFDILGKMKVDLKNLLHTEQEYSYFEPFHVGDSLNIKTKVRECRERRGSQSVLTILSIASEFFCQGRLKALSLTTFVIRENGGNEK